MTTETVLTDGDFMDIYTRYFEHRVTPSGADEIIRAVEQAVLQSPEIQRLRAIEIAAQSVLDWTEIRHRPPVREAIPIGESAGVRVHALADLHDALRADTRRVIEARAASTISDQDRSLLVEAIRSKLPNGKEYGIDWTTVTAEAAGKPRPYGDGTFNAAEVLAIQHCVGDGRIVKFTVANGAHPDSQG